MLRILIIGLLALLPQQGVALTGYYIHASGLPDSIRPANRGGLDCWEMLVRKSDPRGYFGDTPTTLRQRAQFIGEYRAPMDSTHTKNFRILIPDDWKDDPYPVLVAGVHSVAFSIAPWAIWVYGDHFTFEAAAPDATSENGFRIVIHREIPIIKEKWYSFKLTEHISKNNPGFFSLTVDGKNLTGPKDYSGPTLHPDDTGLPYTQYGPYVFDHWPAGINHRRIFLILE